jgi:ribosomal protein L35
MRRSANQSHNLEHKAPKQKRGFRKELAVDGDNAKTVNRMLGRR